jgi:hypothetical protein
MKLKRRKTYDDEFNVHKFETFKTMMTKVYTNSASTKSKIDIPLNDEIEEPEDNENVEMMRMVTAEEEAMLKRMLSSHFLFTNFDEQTIASLIDDLIEFNLDEGRTLYEEGDDGHYFYLIVKGELECSENEENIKIIKEGECIGELALLQKCKRTSTVRALTNCVLFVLEGSNFRDKRMK